MARARRPAEKVSSGGGLRTPLDEDELAGLVEAVPPSGIGVIIATIAQTEHGRAALLKAALSLAAETPDNQAGTSPAGTTRHPEDRDVDTAALMRVAGPMLSSTDVAKLLGQTRQNVNDMVKGGRLLGLRFGTRWRFPEIQFRHHEVVPGLPVLLAAMGDIDPWRKLWILLAPVAAAGLHPMEMLQGGERAAALTAVARAAAEIRLASGAPLSHTILSAAMDEDVEASLRKDGFITASRTT